MLLYRRDLQAPSFKLDYGCAIFFLDGLYIVVGESDLGAIWYHFVLGQLTNNNSLRNQEVVNA